MKKKTKVIIGIAAAVVVIGIAAAIYLAATAVKPMVINEGRTLVLKPGERMELSEVPFSGDGLSREDAGDAVISSDDPGWVRLDDGVLEATSELGDLNEDDEGYLSDSFTYTLRIDNDSGRWEGDVRIKVAVKEVKFDNGEVIKEPAGSRDASLSIEPSDYCNMIVYMKSRTDSSHDTAVYFKKGAEKTSVRLPSDTYTAYVAGGDKFYGDMFKFAYAGQYYKDSEVCDLNRYIVTLTLSSIGDQNSYYKNVKRIERDQFPDIRR